MSKHLLLAKQVYSPHIECHHTSGHRNSDTNSSCLVCVHPEQTFYTPSRANGDPDTRREDCGAKHTPDACPPSGLGIGDATNTSPDEFPFASLEQGGRTPYGDGASVLCVPLAEQKSRSSLSVTLWPCRIKLMRFNSVGQGGKVRQLYNGLNDGDEFELALQDTTGM